MPMFSVPRRWVVARSATGMRGQLASAWREENMRIGFARSCVIGLAIALGAVSTVNAQQPDSTQKTTVKKTHTTKRKTTVSTKRIPVTKENAGEVAQPAPTPTVNQYSIAAAERARQDSIAAANERARQDSIARMEQLRCDSIAMFERRRADSA